MTFVRFTTSVPKQLLSVGLFRLGMLNEIRKLGRRVKKDFDSTVKTWDNKVKFKVQPSLKGSAVTVTISTDSELYALVSDGTAAREVTLKEGSGKRALKFPGTFTAKTVPGVIGSRKGERSNMIFRKHAKGRKKAKARKFDAAIEKKWKKEAPKELQRGIERVADKTGYVLP